MNPDATRKLCTAPRAGFWSCWVKTATCVWARKPCLARSSSSRASSSFCGWPRRARLAVFALGSRYDEAHLRRAATVYGVVLLEA